MGKVMPRARFLTIACELGSIEPAERQSACHLPRKARELRQVAFVRRVFRIDHYVRENLLVWCRTLRNSPQSTESAQLHCDPLQHRGANARNAASGCIFGIWERPVEGLMHLRHKH